MRSARRNSPRASKRAEPRVGIRVAMGLVGMWGGGGKRYYDAAPLDRSKQFISPSTDTHYVEAFSLIRELLY